MQSSLFFSVGDKVRILSEEYIVYEKSVFRDASNDYRWSKYKLVIIGTDSERWIIVDSFNSCYFSSAGDYNIENLAEDNQGFEAAEVIFCSSKDKFNTGEVIKYKVIKDSLGDRIIYSEISNWKLETIKAEVINKEFIEIEEDNSEQEYLEEQESMEIFEEYEREDAEKIEGIVNIPLGSGGASVSFPIRLSKKTWAIILVTIFIVGGIRNFIVNNSLKYNGDIGSYILTSKDQDFASLSDKKSYSNDEKAFIYTTYLSVENAAKIIKRDVGFYDDEYYMNEGGTAIAIITWEEYCFIYKGIDGQTIVQVSYRLYSYTNGDMLYNASDEIQRFYEASYYNYGYEEDTKRFREYDSPYEYKSYLKLKNTFSQEKVGMCFLLFYPCFKTSY
ncbi:hypothetical protein ACQPU1_15860 [Clostridium paraputrificum]|uniref:hypothetical protein n=1 Tax=Clostridium TaxID=1485 RepID=UPI003D32A67B